MRALERRVPPLLAWAASAGLAVALDRAWPELGCRWPGQVPAGLVLAAGGGAVAGAGVREFRRAATTMSPLAGRKARALVTTGVYRFSRNPMYLGLLLALGGVVVALGSGPALATLPALAAFLHHFQIAPEERALAADFGAEFAAYCSRTRRWI